MNTHFLQATAAEKRMNAIASQGISLTEKAVATAQDALAALAKSEELVEFYKTKAEEFSQNATDALDLARSCNADSKEISAMHKNVLAIASELQAQNEQLEARIERGYE